MKKLLICIFMVSIIACSAKVLKDSDYLKYGMRASVIEKVWGKADETMAFQDYRAKGYFSYSGIGGSWGRYGGSVSGHEFGTTYTPTTIVWIYKNKGKALFFQQRGLLDEPYKYSPMTIMIWKLVGWENIRAEETDREIETKRKLDYVKKKLEEAGITSESDVKLFWAISEKCPQDLSLDEQVEWTIKRTKAIISQPEKK
jgi:hypothetical protein